MAFIQNWRVRWIQHLVGWLRIPDHLLPESWPLQKAAELPPHPASKPKFTCLFPSADPHSSSSLGLSMSFFSFQLCSLLRTHTQIHKYAHTHTHTAPKALPTEHLQSWVTALGSGHLLSSKLSLLRLPPLQTPKQSCWTHTQIYFSTQHFSVSMPF